MTSLIFIWLYYYWIINCIPA